jgi:two-component sensor histidine kinase
MLVRVVFSSLGASLPFASFFPAVLVAALVAGVPAALIVMLGAVVVGWWAFIPPAYEFHSLNSGQWADLSLFLFSSACIVVLAIWHRTTLDRLREYDSERDLLMKELEHRGRNTYAVIEAIVYKTLEDDHARADAIAGRIRAVKYTNDLISQSRTHSVSLENLLLHEFAAYGTERFDPSGPEVVLSPDAARQLVLVFHEMVTNAAKHGALSKPEGRVRVSWKIDGGTVVLEWKEHGGPPVSPPQRYNFGSRLVTQCLKTLSGESVPTFAPEGLHCVITFGVLALDR